MAMVEAPQGFCIDAARTAYRGARAAYRQLRALRNGVLNRLDRPLLILVYHRVTSLASDPELLAVSPENFRRQMEFLQREYRLLRMDDDWSDLQEPALVLTFDDGYADNLLEALPVLEALGVPATFFVSSGRVGTGTEFWWHQLEGLLLREGVFPARFTLRDPGYGRAWDTATLAQRHALYAALSARLLRFGPERQQDWLEQLRRWAAPGPGGESRHRCLTREELQRLAASPWASIGAHSVSHSALSALSAERQRDEIFRSKQDLEQIIGREITTFSYPFGRKVDYNRTSVRLCREAGFRKAAANFPGQVHRWTDPLQLPRHLVRNWDAASFAAAVKGFWTR